MCNISIANLQTLFFTLLTRISSKMLKNRNDKRQRELEAEIRALRKQLAEKDEVIDVLKKSVGIFSKL